MKKLPKVFKKKWLKALRSGEYNQGVGQLYNGEGYCCLGVGCVVNTGESLASSENGFAYDKKLLPAMLLGDEYNNDIADILSTMNDSGVTRIENKIMPSKRYVHKRSFKQIANWIEKNL